MYSHTHNFPFRRHALVLALALATGSAPAATLNVSGACTLVNAINNANSDTDTDGNSGCGAGSGDDTLELEANAVYTLTAVNNDTNGANGLPSITSIITINGNGATINRSSEANTPSFRLLNIAENGNLTLNRLKLTGGKVNNNAGGLFNRGILNITDSIISGNSASAVGGISNDYGNIKLTNSIISGNSADQNGGIGNNWGTVTLINSIISGNNATYGAGGIITVGGYGITLTGSTISGNTVTGSNFGYGGIRNLYGRLTLINSTVSDNNAPRTGAIWSAAGNITIINSTISNNSAPQTGGIWSSDYDITLINTTISGNTSNSGGYGGIFSEGNLTLTNSVIANSSGGADCFIYSGNSLILQGANLIEDGSCGASLSGDPKLRRLLDNGGLTLTHALPGDSPAVSAADRSFCEATDQRNIRRLQLCDLGAFERKSKIPESIAPLIQFLDDQVASGKILGNIPGQKIDRRIALRNQLLTAGDYLNRHLKTEACTQLTRTLGYIDPDNKPEADDYVTGSGGSLLIDEINALRGKWSCS